MLESLDLVRFVIYLIKSMYINKIKFTYSLRLQSILF